MSEIFEVSDKWVVSEEWVRDSSGNTTMLLFPVEGWPRWKDGIV